MNKDNLFKDILDFFKKSETISVLLIAGFVVAAILSMYLSPQIYQRSMHEGDIALKDVYAPYDFSYEWGVDEVKTEAAKAKAASKVPYFLEKDRDAEAGALEGIEAFYSRVESEQADETTEADKISKLKDGVAKDISNKSVKTILDYQDIGVLKTGTLNVMRRLLDQGYINFELLDKVKERAGGSVSMVDENTQETVISGPEVLLNKNSIKGALDNMLSEEFPSDKNIRPAVSELVMKYIPYNLRINEEKTEAATQEAVARTEPKYRLWTVKKNELVIEKGIRVNSQHIAQFSHMRSMFRPGTTPTFFIGVVLLFMLLLMVAVIHTYFTSSKPDALKQTKNISVVLFNMLIMIMISDFVMNQPQPSYFIPLAGMGMLITLLVGFNVAFLSVVLMGMLISLLMVGKIEVLFVLFVGSVTGMFAVRDVRRRTRILWAGLVAGGAKSLAIIAVGLINGFTYDVLIRDAAWGVASGIFSGFLVMGLLPFFEHVFKVPTNISLLELCDMNHPLLKKLAMEAPGTYHHSIMVGNLAESACDAIGANSLMARVGAYYHDIGKIPKAEYYSENEMGAGSKHAKLAPSMSALIISKHVKEGVEIGKQYKLNSDILDFIRQHHGNSLIAYFYQKALEKAEDPAELKEENFRYPGPRPQTKESAIVLLADAVEASSRALEDPTPSSIRNLVKKIINNKFIDGQLDECDLTLKDMHRIAMSFERVLMGIFHVRVPYPEESRKSGGAAADENKGKHQKPEQKKKD